MLLKETRPESIIAVVPYVGVGYFRFFFAIKEMESPAKLNHKGVGLFENRDRRKNG